MIAKVERLDISGVGVEVVKNDGNKDFYFYENFENRNDGIERAMKQLYPMQDKGLIQSISFIDGTEEKTLRIEACERLKKYDIPIYDTKFKKDLLARMKSDCDYFLGYGDRQEKYLWAGNVNKHIEIMQDLYKSIQPSNRPEWINLEKIWLYQEEMIKKEPQYDRILMGEDLNGSKENAMDLEVALATGKDLDGVDIPNDKSEERNGNANEPKMNIKEIKKQAEQHLQQKSTTQKVTPHIEKKVIDR